MFKNPIQDTPIENDPTLPNLSPMEQESSSVPSTEPKVRLRTFNNGHLSVTMYFDGRFKCA